MRVPWCENSKLLYVLGMPERIRWVPAPGSPLFGEIGRGFNFWDVWKIYIATHPRFRIVRKMTNSYIFVFMVGGSGHEIPVFVRLLFDIYLFGGVQPPKVPAKEIESSGRLSF